MATDSDVEAYLNQLSKKTYTLKQDAKTLVYSSSRPTSSADDPSDDELNSSDIGDSPVRTHKVSSMTQRKDIDSISDIAALSRKYEDIGYRQTCSYDKISNLEDKYLKKQKASKGVARSEISKATKRQVKIDSNQATYRRKPQQTSDSSSVDEELARYLNETSLTDELDGKFSDAAAAVTKYHSSSEGGDDSMDEVINFDNILTVNDILGQMTDGESKSDHESASRKCEGEITGNSKNSVNEKDSKGAIGSNIDAGDKTSLFIKKNNTASSSNTLQVKLSDVNNGDLSQNSKHKKFHDSKEKEKNILLNSRKSFFYSGNQEDEDDSDEPVGVLLAQTSSNVFHSSRRNSLIEFKKESIAKSKTSKSNLKNKNKSKFNSDESVLESIATSIKSSTVASEVETEHGTISRMDQDVEEDIVRSAYSSQTGDRMQERMQNDASKCASDTEQNISLKAQSPVSKECSQDNHTQGKYAACHSTRTQKRPESSRQKNMYKSKNILDSEQSTKHNKSSRRASKHSRKCCQHSNCKMNRTSTSESSSESMTSDSESDHRHRHHSWHRKHRSKPVFSPWLGLPCMQLWPQHHQAYAASTGIFTHYPSPLVAEGLFGMGSVVGVEDVMRQQVALTRQFLDSQQALYHAYTATLTSSHRYTSLSNTEKYIKKRKPPLTFSEAYKLVKEEMKASEG